MERAAAFALALLASPASLATTSIDGVEHIFGASNVHAVTGHGRLTAGVSRDGDLTVLAWPSPSYADQLAYLSSNALDARSLPRFGAAEGAGSFLGLLVDRGTDALPEATWLRDPSTWTASQSYGEADGPNPVTSFESASLGLTVVLTDAIDPAADVLVRRVRIERAPGSTVAAASLLVYANLSPLPPNARLDFLPIVDWVTDGRNDFAAVWHETESAVIHFHPADRRIVDAIGELALPPQVDWGAAGELLGSSPLDPAAVADLASGLDLAYGPGAYLAMTTVPPPDAHQIGYDATDLCGGLDDLVANLHALAASNPSFVLPLDPALLDAVRCPEGMEPVHEVEGWLHEAKDALADLEDGELESSPLAAGEVNTALRAPLEFDAAGVAEASVVLAAGGTAAEALAALDLVREDPAAVAIAAEEAVSGWLADRRLPDNDDALVRRVARRSLLNLRVGTVAGAGAGTVVASITRQPPYGLDWPRDGAFFNVLFDASGQSDLAHLRAALYDAWQRKEPEDPIPLVDIEPPPDPETGEVGGWPAGAWEMNHYEDGAPGGTWRFEIDNAGFALWMICAHAGWIEDAGDRAGYLGERWGAIRLAADLLARWRDPETGLQAPAQEDDNAAYTQTLHGAVTTFGALEIASRAAREIGEDEDALRWESRAGELRDAILEHLFDPEAGLFVAGSDDVWNPGSLPLGQTAWLVWPMTLLPWDDPRIEDQIDHDLAAIAPKLSLEDQGGAYFLKTVLSACLARGQDPEARPALQAALESVALQATLGTSHFGEVAVTVAGAGGPEADQRVATPHLWEGALFFLSALALDDPAAILRYDEVLPPSQVPPPPPPPEPDPGGEPEADPAPEPDAAGEDAAPAPKKKRSSGCGGAPGPAVPMVFALGFLLVLRSRRKVDLPLSGDRPWRTS